MQLCRRVINKQLVNKSANWPDQSNDASSRIIAVSEISYLN